jgi:hypothetical protein
MSRSLSSTTTASTLLSDTFDLPPSRKRGSELYEMNDGWMREIEEGAYIVSNDVCVCWARLCFSPRHAPVSGFLIRCTTHGNKSFNGPD